MFLKSIISKQQKTEKQKVNKKTKTLRRLHSAERLSEEREEARLYADVRPLREGEEEERVRGVETP